MKGKETDRGLGAVEIENGRGKYLLNMSVTMSISCSAAAIFSADEGWGRPSPNIDMIAGCVEDGLRWFVWNMCEVDDDVCSALVPGAEARNSWSSDKINAASEGSSDMGINISSQTSHDSAFTQWDTLSQFDRCQQIEDHFQLGEETLPFLGDCLQLPSFTA